MKQSDSITINSPIENVFDIWTDVERYSEWAAPVVMRKKLTDGPVGIGTKFKCIDKWPGRQVEFEMEITEYEKNKRFGAKWFKPMAGKWTSNLKEEKLGTTLIFEMEVHLPFFMRLLTPIMKRYAIKQNRKFMLNLKDHIENR